MPEEAQPSTTLAVQPEAALAEPKRATNYTMAHAQEARLPSAETINYMTSVAKLLLSSALVTPDMGNTEDQIKANAIAKMLVGWEFGINPIEALQSINIVKGNVFVRYHQLLNIMTSKGVKLKWVEMNDDRAELRVVPPGGAIDPFTVSFDMKEAEARGLTKSTRLGEPSMYMKMPGVMHIARCISKAYRMCGIGGPNAYANEERQEVLMSEAASNDERGDSSNRAFSEAGKKPANPLVKKPVEAIASGSGPSPEPGPAKAEEKIVDTTATQVTEATPESEAPATADETTTAAPDSPATPAVQISPDAQKVSAQLEKATGFVQETFGTLNPTAVLSKIVSPFLKAFTGMDRLPKAAQQPGKYFMAARAIEGICRCDSAALQANPTLSGKNARESMSRLLDAFKLHGPDIQTAVLDNFFYRLADCTPDEAVEYYAKQQRLSDPNSATAEDVLDYLRLFRASRSAYKLRAVGLSTGSPMRPLLDRVEKQLKMKLEDSVNEETVGRAIDLVASGLDIATVPDAPIQQEPEEPVKPVATNVTEDSAQGGLW